MGQKYMTEEKDSEFSQVVSLPIYLRGIIFNLGTAKTLTSAGKDLHDNFLKALAVREEDNRSGKVSSVIFIRDKNSHGQEVSGYIDYAHRLKTEDFEVYFSGKKRLLPRPTDMRLNLVTTLLEARS
nr:PREDICTED: uncharacterized protein C4orf22 homolog [Bos indicus]